MKTWKHDTPAVEGLCFPTRQIDGNRQDTPARALTPLRDPHEVCSPIHDIMLQVQYWLLVHTGTVQYRVRVQPPWMMYCTVDCTCTVAYGWAKVPLVTYSVVLYGVHGTQAQYKYKYYLYKYVILLCTTVNLNRSRVTFIFGGHHCKIRILSTTINSRWITLLPSSPVKRTLVMTSIVHHRKPEHIAVI
jgi:hypothetical protein